MESKVKKAQNLKIIFLSFFLGALSLFNPLAPCMAAMSSSDFIIDMPNLNFSAGKLSSTDYRLGFTAGELTPGLFSSTGYRVRSGFWYIKSIIPFAFSVSPTSVDFGALTANSPVTQALTLTVSAGGAGGYRVTGQETKPLTSASLVTIPDTTCDNNDCDEDTAGVWTENTTFGFGYTLHGNDVPTPFPTGAPAGSQYKQFSNIAGSETAETIMTSASVGKNRSATLTMKLNVSGIQAAGIYQNSIIFIATPGY